jgi:hypothetical protein
VGRGPLRVLTRSETLTCSVSGHKVKAPDTGKSPIFDAVSGVAAAPRPVWKPCATVLRESDFAMNQLEQLTRDVRGFAMEVRRLGYSSVANGHENQFLELSERMSRRADAVDRPR